MDKQEKKKFIYIILISFGWGLITTALMTVCALIKDDRIECKVIYDYNQYFQYEPYLYVDSVEKNYEISPHTPLNDTYECPWTWYEESYMIPYEAIPMERFALELIQNQEKAKICSIEFYNHGYQIAKFSPSDINELFFADGGDVEVGSTVITITGDGHDIFLQGNELFYREIIKYPNYNAPLYWNSIFWGGIIGVLAFTVLYRRKILRVANGKNPLSKKEVFMAIGLGGIFILVCLMSVFSKHYAHPDEPVTRMAIDYYLAGWRRPDINSSFVSGTLSIYGVSRLRESTIYYFLAGKTGWIFKEFFYIPIYYRIFNLLLMGLMLFSCWKQRKKQKWMIVALCMTPQMWYLYAYATSDAWDWFCGFIMIYLLIQKNVYLYKQVDSGKYMSRAILSCLGYGLIFAMILLGKTNYHVLLGVAFIDFLLDWFQQKKNKIQIIILYFAILIISFALKEGIERIPKAEPETSFSTQIVQAQQSMKSEQKEKYKEYLNSSLRDAGMSFSDMLWHYSSWPTPLTLFASATGCYMWLALYSGIGYYVIIALIYLSFFIAMIITAWKNRKGNIIVNLKLVSSIIICFLIVVIILLYCWVQTYQPQGRYLLTIWLILGYVCAQYKEIFANKVLKGAIVMACLAGCWSFAVYGLYAMLQQGFLLIR